MSRNYISGFTLLELLISVFIFSIISTILFAGVNQISKQSGRLLEKDRDFSQLRVAIAIMENDLLQMAPRIIRNQDGAFLPSMYSNDYGGIEFSRAGNNLPGKSLQSSLLRVEYLYDKNTIYRRIWNNMDRVPADTGRQKVLLSKVNSFNIGYLGDEGWLDEWPEYDDTLGSAAGLPRMIRLTIDTADFGVISKIIPGASDFTVEQNPEN